MEKGGRLTVLMPTELGSRRRKRQRLGDGSNRMGKNTEIYSMIRLAEGGF